MNDTPGRILDTAKEMASSADAWADLANALFDPADGVIAKAYPTRQERAAFLKTREYQIICRWIDAAIERTGFVAGATPKKSGKFMVRLPKSLHAALAREAAEEGVSLNQLVVTKLALQLSHLTRDMSSAAGGT